MDIRIKTILEYYLNTKYNDIDKTIYLIKDNLVYYNYTRIIILYSLNNFYLYRNNKINKSDYNIKEFNMDNNYILYKNNINNEIEIYKNVKKIIYKIIHPILNLKVKGNNRPYYGFCIYKTYANKNKYRKRYYISEYYLLKCNYINYKYNIYIYYNKKNKANKFFYINKYFFHYNYLISYIIFVIFVQFIKN